MQQSPQNIAKHQFTSPQSRNSSKHAITDPLNNYDPFQLPMRANSAMQRPKTSWKRVASRSTVPFTNTQVSRPSRMIMREAYPVLLSNVSRENMNFTPHKSPSFK